MWGAHGCKSNQSEEREKVEGVEEEGKEKVVIDQGLHMRRVSYEQTVE
jgi:hypothetical protein